MKDRPSSCSGRSEDSIKALAQRFDLEVIFKLSLASKGLPNISCLENCINLTDLDLSSNTIAKVEGLETLTELRRLSLANNRLTRLDGLWTLKKVDTLRLQGNQITLDGLSLPLLAQLPALRALYLQNIDRSMQNPACRQRGYKAALLAQLASLTNLDGERSPAAINYAEVAEEADELVAHPPQRKELVLPDVEPWFPASDATSAAPAAPVVDAEFQSKSAALVRGLDDCHALAEVLKEELGKFQRQLIA